MDKDQLTKHTHKEHFFGVNLLLMIAAFFVIGNNAKALTHLTTGATSYAITLDASNAPTSLSDTTFGSGSGFGRYVEFEYTVAKRSAGVHVLLNQNGELFNRADTRITSIQSIIAVFTGGEATLLDGPTISLVNHSQVITSGVEVTFTTNPYFFMLKNTGGSELSLTSLVINYTCIYTHSTIDFVENGGSEVEPYVLAPGTTIDAPTAPTYAGYVFEGWYTEATFINLYTFSTMPQDDLVLYAKWSFDETIVPLTISAFKALEGEAQSELQFVKGVVILAKENLDVIIIADETDTLIVFDSAEVAIGDSVRISGFYSLEDNLIIMGPSINQSISVAVHTYEIDVLAPTEFTVGDFNALDPDTPTNWVVYAEINGTINVDSMTQKVNLVSGETSVGIGIFDEQTLNFLYQYNGFRVNIRGVILPNMDEPETTLMFLFNGDEKYIDLDYDTNPPDELALLLEQMFEDYYASVTYFPGQYVDLPTSHPIIDVELTYETFGDNASKFDVVTKRFAQDISGSMNIGLTVYLVLYEVPYDFDITLTVDDAIIITIAELRAEEDSQSVSHVVQGVVTNIQVQGEDNLLLIADATGFVYVNTNSETIAVGDEVVAIGYKMTYQKLVFLYNNPAITVDHVVATNQSMPMTPIVSTLSAFNDLDYDQVETDFAYYKLEGHLTALEPENPSSNVFILTSGEEQVLLFASSSTARATLLSLVDQDVVARGVGFVNRNENFIYLAILSIPDSVEAIV